MAETIEISSVDYKAYGTNYYTIWSALTGPIFRVVDEDGNNCADAQVRHFAGKHWLYVDDQDGYTIMDEHDVERLYLV